MDTDTIDTQFWKMKYTHVGLLLVSLGYLCCHNAEVTLAECRERGARRLQSVTSMFYLVVSEP